MGVIVFRYLFLPILLALGCGAEPWLPANIEKSHAAIAEKPHKSQAWEAAKAAMRRIHAPDRVTFGEWEAIETPDGGVVIVTIVATCTVETDEGVVIQHKFRCKSDRTHAGHWGFGSLKYLETKILFTPPHLLKPIT